MPSLPRLALVLSLGVSALVSAAVLPRADKAQSNVYKLLQDDANYPVLPDLDVWLVEPTSTDVRGDVPDITDLTADVIPEEADEPNARVTILSAETDTDRLLFSVTLSSFLSSKAARSPSNLDWTDDGCSFSPDYPSGFNFLHSCQRHDFGYRNYKAQSRFTDAGRKRIDDKFKADLYNECAKYSGISDNVCRGLADTYYSAVRTFGGL